MTGRTYHLRCPGCGAEWSGAGGFDADRAAGEADAFAVCGECGSVSCVRVRLTAEELSAYRRDLMKAVQKMYQGFYKARARLEEKVKALGARLSEGERECEGEMRAVETRLQAMRQPDTAHLEARVGQVEAVLARGTDAAPPPSCPTCGAAPALYRETHRGYEVPCPRCASELVVRVGR